MLKPFYTITALLIVLLPLTGLAQEDMSQGMIDENRNSGMRDGMTMVAQGMGTTEIQKAAAAPAPQPAFAVPDSFKTRLDQLYTAYFKIHDALSTDSLIDSRRAVVPLLAALNNIDLKLLQGAALDAWKQQINAIATSAHGISGAKDLEAARAAFDRLSQAMVATTRAFGTSGNLPLYVLHCPMAFNNRGADWLQDTPETENPYFGKAMFTSGVVTDTLSTGKIK